MVRVWYITHLLLLVTATLADYYIDNADTSVTYAIPAGQSWQIFSTSTQSLALQLTNSTGNYTITLDSSNCYDENYSLGVCGTDVNCYVQIPFTGSGITMYVFNAGPSGMTASFSIDGGPGVVNSIDGPTAAENYQVSNVSLYDIQGLAYGNHTIEMTLMDWNGGGTSMKFDYAYVNETFVTTPTSSTTPPTPTTSTSQMSTQSTQTSSAIVTATQTPHTLVSNKLGTGAIVGIVVGLIAVIMILVGICLYCRGRKAPNRNALSSSPSSRSEIEPFSSVYFSASSKSHAQHSSLLAQLPEMAFAVPPHKRLPSGVSSTVLQPLRRQPSHNAESTDTSFRVDGRWTTMSASSDESPVIAGYNLTAQQLEIIREMKANGFPPEEIMRISHSFVPSRSSTPSAPPPSYQS